MLIHSEDTRAHKQWCSSRSMQDCTDTYTRETKQPVHKRMAGDRTANSSGQDSAVHLHLNKKGHSSEDNNVNILSREDRWFEGGVKESIYIKLE